MSGHQPRVYLVDDHAMFRAGVRAELAPWSISSARPVPVSRRCCRNHQIPAGCRPAGCSYAGRWRTGRHRRRGGDQSAYLALSVSDAAEDVIAIIRAGARGYVTKTISAPELADAVRRVAADDVVFSPRLAGFVLDAFRDAPVVPSIDPELDQLTPRELEVLRLLARGYAYKEIANELFISIKTVETHASNVLRKLQLSNRHQLTRWAADRRML